MQAHRATLLLLSDVHSLTHSLSKHCSLTHSLSKHCLAPVCRRSAGPEAQRRHMPPAGSPHTTRAEVVGGQGPRHQLGALLVWPQPLPRDLARNRGSPPCRVTGPAGVPLELRARPRTQLPSVTGHYVLVCTHPLLSRILRMYHQTSRYFPGL